MEQNGHSNNWHVWIATIASIFSVVAIVLSWFGVTQFVDRRLPQEINEDIPIQKPSTIESEQPSEEALLILNDIPFSLQSNPSELNPILSWYPGESSQNAYFFDLKPNKFSIFADAYSDQFENLDSAPLVYLPIKGDFTAQVRVESHPRGSYQFAGIGVRSPSSKLTWVRAVKGYFGSETIGFSYQQNGRNYKYGVDFPHTAPEVYLKISRRESLFWLYFSNDGMNWTKITGDVKLDLPNEVEVYVIVFSAKNSEGFSAHFDQFEIIQE